MKYFINVILIVLSFLAGYYFGSIGPEGIITKPLVIHDTTLVERWESKIARDTVFKFIDKIVFKEIPASVVTYQKVDTVFLKKIERLNTLIDVRKEKDSLKVFTVNIDKSLAREFTFPSDLREFRLVAKNDDVLYAEKRMICTFDGVKLGSGISYKAGSVDPKYFIEMNAGLLFFKRAELDIFLDSRPEYGIKIFYRF